MAIRKDGIESSIKLLKAASQVFAEKGYHKTTVEEICRRAGSNIAAVNYHYGSKDELYRAVWRNAFEEAMKVYPPDGSLPQDAPADQKLRAFIYSNLHRMLDDGRLGCAGQILLREMAEPTEAVGQIFHDVIGPLHERTQQIIRELLEPAATEQNLSFCEMSVVHQCVAIGFLKGKENPPPFWRKDKQTPAYIDELAEHITLFSLAGIRTVREQSKQKQNLAKPRRTESFQQERSS
ncbi:MAG: CerR family C-terminal domain-containing protein [Sedimentisphaerales bacterium]|nr:CerR family C-terminal domain-containing protein [Sedimentisphaerales bacterium]